MNWDSMAKVITTYSTQNGASHAKTGAHKRSYSVENCCFLGLPYISGDLQGFHSCRSICVHLLPLAVTLRDHKPTKSKKGSQIPRQKGQPFRTRAGEKTATSCLGVSCLKRTPCHSFTFAHANCRVGQRPTSDTQHQEFLTPVGLPFNFLALRPYPADFCRKCLFQYGWKFSTHIPTSMANVEKSSSLSLIKTS